MSFNTGFTFEPNNMYQYVAGFFMNPSVYIIIIFVIIFFIFIFTSLGNSSSNTPSYTDTDIFSNVSSSSATSSSSSKTMMIFIGIIIIILIISFLILRFHTVLWNIINLINLNSTAKINNALTGNPVIDINVKQPTPNETNFNENTSSQSSYSKKPQVFNIPGNYYGYEEANTLCKAYDSRLATYEEVEKTYKEGGEWCNYGWSDGQMALFPTQAETYKNLQNIPGHEHDCGRPGINGGYIANPHVRFGVNCFGQKPKITKVEADRMANATPYPKSEKDILMEKQVNYWKKKLDNILISPFNYTNWSKV